MTSRSHPLDSVFKIGAAVESKRLRGGEFSLARAAALGEGSSGGATLRMRLMEEDGSAAYSYDWLLGRREPEDGASRVMPAAVAGLKAVRRAQELRASASSNGGGDSHQHQQLPGGAHCPHQPLVRSSISGSPSSFGVFPLLMLSLPWGTTVVDTYVPSSRSEAERPQKETGIGWERGGGGGAREGRKRSRGERRAGRGEKEGCSGTEGR